MRSLLLLMLAIWLGPLHGVRSVATQEPEPAESEQTKEKPRPPPPKPERRPASWPYDEYLDPDEDDAALA